MQDRLPRKLAAILYADVAGYSRLTGEDEDATHRALSDYLDLITSTVESRRGQVMHYAGDAVLAQFSAVVDAVSAALAVQTALQARNETLEDKRKVQFRIGVNLGDVIEDRGDIYGDGVKNIKEPVRAYRVFEHDSTPSVLTRSLPKPNANVTALSFGKPSVAVKPFVPMGRDEEQQQLADGLTNGIAVALTRLPGLTFINDESPSLAESNGLTIQELASRFDVRYVLKGGIQKIGNKIRVSAELIEVSSSQTQWAGKFDRALEDFGDFFAIQDDITEEIVTALDVKLLSGEAARLVRRAFKDPVALEYYFRGEDLLWRATMKLEFREAERLFEEAIRLQPDSPVGYAAAALAYWVEVISGLSDSPSRTLDQAVRWAHEAISRNDVTGYAHLVLAHVHLQNRDFDEAMTEATNAVLDRPSCPAAYALKAAVLTYVGRPNEAIEFAQYATRLAPVHPPMFPAILATALYGSERYEEAIAAAQAAIDLRETDVDPYLVLAASKTAMDRTEEARFAAEKVIELVPSFNLAEFSEAQPYKEQTQISQLLNHLRLAGFQ